MPNVFEAVVDYIKTTMDNEPKSLPHIGEAMGCWLYFTAIAEEIPALEASLNTSTDDEMLSLIKRSLSLAEHQKQILETFMLDEGIPLAPIANHKPKSSPNSVPLGVKVTDDEIANFIAIKVASNIVMASTNMAQCIRNDIGLMWARFHAEKMIFGMELKTAMRKRGWIKVPPYYNPPGAPSN
jgi:hypothetical protein